jgi:predicted Zn-dependent protease
MHKACFTNQKMMRMTMNRICTIYLGAALLAVSPTVTYAAGSSDDNNASETSAKDKYQSAVAAVEEKDFRKAISLLNDVIGEKPNHPDALNYLGYSHRKLGDFARGVSYYKKALSLEAGHKGANEYLGQAYVELGNMAGAEKQLTALEGICGTGCEEYKSLKTAIEAAKSRQLKKS